MLIKALNPMNMIFYFILFLLLFGCTPHKIQTNESALYHYDKNASTRWASFENPQAKKSGGALLNKGAKGYPYHLFEPGERKVLLKTHKPGVIHRIWMTIDKLFDDPSEMRRMRIDMYWDGSEKPAVSVPVADFFCIPLGRMVSFENELFASPEGKSFVCYAPMPYRKSALITLTNESSNISHRVFYDINFSEYEKPDTQAMYFHACWRRENPTQLGKDFTVLPIIHGKGRFLGANIGVITDKRNLGWWGEGEIKIYLDGDEHPTLCGTGTEDYISTGWGQGQFSQRFHGSHLVDWEKGLFGFYRLHIPDPVWFNTDCRVTLQQLGGTKKKEVKDMLAAGIKVKPVTVIPPDRIHRNLLDGEYNFEDEQFSDDMWTVYYRTEDVCATAYFYLDAPSNNLPVLPPLSQRTAGLKKD